MSENTSNATSYDEFLYRTHCYPQTHPDRLATIARLLGLRTALPTQCQVLEIGCGTGSNLIPMAYHLPGSTFWGIDAAQTPIQQGRRLSEELGLKNLRLDGVDMLEFSPGGVEFDFIIAHGIYSWVNRACRSRIFEICRNFLSPNGVAYISYNAYPGWQLHTAVRDIMRFHVRGFSNPVQRTHQAKSILQFLLKANPERDYYQTFLKKDMEEMSSDEDYHLYHDELAEENTPFYFLQFTEEAAKHELQYLGEAKFSEMQDFIYPDMVAAVLKQMDSNSRLLKEQYLDYIKCRRFRQTLLCHRGIVLEPKVREEVVRDFFITALLQPRSSEYLLASPEVVYFDGPDGSIMATDSPIGRAAFLELRSVWPAALGFEELHARALSRLSDPRELQSGEREEGKQILLNLLLGGYHAGALEFYLHPLSIASAPGEHPRVSDLTRMQAGIGGWVSSARHKTVQLKEELWRRLIPLLDGSRNRRQLIELLLDEGKTGVGVSPLANRQDELERNIEKTLIEIAQAGLLLD
jgi:methyltransferase-like protein